MNRVISQLQQQLNSAKLNVNINLSAKSLQAVPGQLRAINTELQRVATSARNVQDIFRGISAALGNNVANSLKNTANAANQSAAAVAKVAKETKTAHHEMALFGKEMGLAIKRSAAFTVATTAIFGVGRAISYGVREAIIFEKELTRVAQVTGTSLKSLKGLADEVGRLSITYGTSSSELLDVAQTLAQAGLSLKDTQRALEAIAKASLAPSFTDTKNTVEALIATIGQFKNELRGVSIQAKDFDDVLGSINAVSAAFAVEADDITAAIRRAGAVFAQASGNFEDPKRTLNEFIAVFTSVRQTTRENAETIATGLRTIFTRIQRPQTIEFLRQFGVELQDLEGNFIGPYKALELLSGALKDLPTNSSRYAQIVEEIGGIRQISKLLPAIKEFSIAQQALRVAQEGTGSTTEQAAIAQQSLSNQITKTREEFLKLIRDISTTDSFQQMIRLALDTASAFIRVADSVKELLPLIGAIAASKIIPSTVIFAKNFGRGVLNLAGGPTGKANGGPVHHFARGGLVPGQGNSDTVPANLMPGEFVIRKKAVEAIGVDRLHKMNGYNKGGRVGFAVGGTVEDYERYILENKLVNKDINLNAGKGKEVLGKNFYKNNPALNGDLYLQAQKNIIARGGLSAIGTSRSQEKLADTLKGKLTLQLGDLSSPQFGGLFLRPAPGSDRAAIQNVTFKSLGPSAKTRILNNSDLRGISDDTRIFGNIEAGFIEANTAKKLESDLSKEFTRSVLNLTRQYGEGFNIPKTSVVKSIIQNSGLEGVTGNMFEAFVSVLTGNIKQNTSDNFDINNTANKGSIEKLFGKTLAPINRLDLKRTYDTSGVTSDLFSKAINSGLPVSLKTGFLGESEKGANFTAGQALSKRVKRAFGGGISGKDTVPALLTPGEFVIRKEAADRIGSASLHRLNHADKIQGFNRGGSVQRFATGGTPTLSKFESSSFLQAAQPAYNDAIKQLVNSGKSLQEAQDIATRALTGLATRIKAAGGTLLDLNSAAQAVNVGMSQGNKFGAALKIAIAPITNIGRSSIDKELTSLGLNSRQVSNYLRKYDQAIQKGVKAEEARTQVLNRYNTVQSRLNQAIENRKQREEKTIQDSALLQQQKLETFAQRLNLASIAGLTVAGGAEYLKQRAGTANQAGALGAVSSGITTGLTGAQLGFSVAGPQGAIAGGVIGSVYGVINGFRDSLETFNQSQAIKKFEDNISRTSILLEELRGSKTSTDNKSGQLLANIRSGVSTARDIFQTEANLNTPLFPKVGPVSELSQLFYNFSTDRRDVDIQQAIIEASKNRDFSKSFGSFKEQSSVLKEIIKDPKFNINRIDESQLKDFALILGGSIPDAQKRAIDQLAQKGIFETDTLGNFNKDFYKQFLDELVKLGEPETQKLINLEKQKRDALQKSNDELVSLNQNLFLFRDALSVLSDQSAKFNYLLSEGASRAENAFASINGDFRSTPISIRPIDRASTETDIKNTYQTLRGFSGNTDLINNNEKSVLEVQNFISNLPDIIGGLASPDIKPDALEQNIADKISKEFGNIPTVIRDEFLQKTKEILGSGGSGEGGSVPKEAIQKIQNIVAELPQLKEYLEAQNRFNEDTIKLENQRRQFVQQQLEGQRILLQKQWDVEEAEFNLRKHRNSRLGKLFSDEDFVFRDRQKAIDLASTADPNKLRDNILEAQRAREDKLKNNSTADTSFEDELLKRNYEALKLVAESNNDLAVINERLSKVEEAKSRLSGANQSIFGGGLKGLLELNKNLSSTVTFLKGGFDPSQLFANFNQIQKGIELIKFVDPTKATNIEDKFVLEFAKLSGIFKDSELLDFIKNRKEARDKEDKFKEDQAAAFKGLATFSGIKFNEAINTQTTALKTASDALNESAKQLQLIQEKIKGVGKAGGGPIYGPGTSTSDSIPARLSHGEFVVKASSARKMGHDILSYINQTGELPMMLAGGGYPNSRLVRPGSGRSRLVRSLYSRESYNDNFINNNGFTLSKISNKLLQPAGTNSGFESISSNMQNIFDPFTTNFRNIVDSLTQSLDRLNGFVLQGQFNHNVNVTINGAAVFESMKPEIAQMITTQISSALQKTLPFEQRNNS
jgi:hypothetical protein